MPTKPIAQDSFHSGGVSDSIYSGIKNSMATMVGTELHAESGLVTAAQQLVNVAKTGSTVTINDFIKASVACSDGNIYFFGSTAGKVWRLESDGTLTLQVTASPAAGSAGILDAVEHEGYIYYAMQNRLGRVAVGAPTAWAGRDDDWATFTNGSTTDHPMFVHDSVLTLYIGDGNLVAQVESGVFSADAINIPVPYKVRSLNKYETDLVIGAGIADTVNKAALYRWNTYSTVSFSLSRIIDVPWIHSMFYVGNTLFVNAGLAGVIYYFDGSHLNIFRQLPGTYSDTKTGRIHHTAHDNLFGNQTLFGLSNVAGNPFSQAIWRFGQRDASYPIVLDTPYPISQRSGTDFVLNNLEIGCVVASGHDVFMTWKDTNSGTVYGIDQIDWSNKLDRAYMESRVIIPDGLLTENFHKMVVNYKSIPSSCDLELQYKNNHSASWQNAIGQITNTESLQKIGGLQPARVMQTKTIFRTSSNTTPGVESIIHTFNTP